MRQNAAITPYSPQVPTDWTVRPGLVKKALDELAQRVTDNIPKESHINLLALATEHAFS